MRLVFKLSDWFCGLIGALNQGLQGMRSFSCRVSEQVFQLNDALGKKSRATNAPTSVRKRFNLQLIYQMICIASSKSVDEAIALWTGNGWPDLIGATSDYELQRHQLIRLLKQVA